MIKKELLELLACPESHAPVLLTEDNQALVSTDTKTRRLFKIEEGIPNFLLDESTVLDENEHAEIVEKAKKNSANATILKDLES